jgi:hypothetical protein
MSDFWLYLKLGLEHVLDLSAYDHILFLVVLCAAYSFDLWKRLLLLVTLFTVGHTISLLLAHFMVVSVNGSYIEFLIPITILVTAIYNIVTAGKPSGTQKNTLFYVVTLFFGLIHGFGFARYYTMISDGDSVLPLLEFALGVELAQVVVVLLTLLAAFIIQAVFRFNKRDWVLVVSSVVIGMIIPMLVTNWPF